MNAWMNECIYPPNYALCIDGFGTLCAGPTTLYGAISLPTHQAADQLSPSSYGNRLFSGARTTKPLTIQPGSAKQPPLGTAPWGLGRRFRLAQAAQSGETAGKRRILNGRMNTPLFRADGFCMLLPELVLGDRDPYSSSLWIVTSMAPRCAGGAVP